MKKKLPHIMLGVSASAQRPFLPHRYTPILFPKDIYDYFISKDFTYERNENDNGIDNYEFLIKDDIKLRFEYYVQYDHEPNGKKYLELWLGEDYHKDYYKWEDNDISLHTVKKAIRDKNIKDILDDGDDDNWYPDQIT